MRSVRALARETQYGPPLRGKIIKAGRPDPEGRDKAAGMTAGLRAPDWQIRAWGNSERKLHLRRHPEARSDPGERWMQWIARSGDGRNGSHQRGPSVRHAYI